MSLIDASYFVAELNIPDSADPAVAERITWFINKYEPEFLQKLMGYPLYKAFVAGMNDMGGPAQRFLDILYGKEYTDFQGRIQKWQGLIVTDTPVFSLAGGLAYRKPEYLTAGVTTGFPSGSNAVTFDGRENGPDWRGWTPILTRVGILKPGVDYSWDSDTGELTLLKPNDKFGNNEDFFAAFELRTDGSVPVLDLSANESCIANYVYFMLRKNSATQVTDYGEVVTEAENSKNASPRKRAAGVWNQLKDWVKDFVAFMEATQVVNATVYPEWQQMDAHNALRIFGFMNPIF